MKKELILFLCVSLFLKWFFLDVSEMEGQTYDPANRYSTETLIPPDDRSFMPPEVRGSYADPIFGTVVKRLTGSQNGYVTNSEIAYFNIDDSYFIATDENITYLFDGREGEKIKRIGGGGLRPWWIRWARGNFYTLLGEKWAFDPAIHFYKYEGNEVRLYNVTTLSYIVLRKFDEYSEIGPAGGEGDLSQDGRYWVLDGKRVSDGKQELFVYDLLNDIKGIPIPFDPGRIGGYGPGVDFATVSPSGNYVVIAWDAGMNDPFNGHYGVEVFERSTWEFVRRLHPCRIHIELGYDAFGEEVMFSAAGNTSEEIKTFGISGLALGDFISVRLQDGYVRKLLDVPRWAHFVLSYSPGQPGYIFVGYDQKSEAPQESWAPYWGEIFAISTDGSEKVIRLVHHRSWRVGNQSSKEYQPDFFLSNKGDKIVFNSTFGIGRADLYMFGTGLVEGIQPPTPAPFNQAPVAYGGSVATFEGIAISGTLGAMDPDGNRLRYVIVNDGSLGKALIIDPSKGTYTYTPDARTIGTDMFTFKVNDGMVDSNVATIVVTINSSPNNSSVSVPPPSYSTFQPPTVSSAYVDPTFGTIVKRLTDSGKADLAHTEITYFNMNNSYFVAMDDKTMYLMDGKDGRKIKALGSKTMMPWYFRWARGNYYTLSGAKKTFNPAKHFYKYEGNEIRLYNVDTLEYVVLHKFTEYSEIGPAGGKGDLSQNGRYWLMDGTKPDGKRALFVYDLFKDIKGPECPFDPGVIGSSRYPGVHFGTVSPSGKYIVMTWHTGASSSFNGHYGIEVFDLYTWRFLRRVHPIWAQFELGYDSLGHEVLFAAAGNTSDDIRSFNIPDLALGDLISVRLDSGTGKKLLDIPIRAGFSLAYASGQNQYVFLSMEARSDSPEKQWAPYWGEIIAVPTDGSGKAIRLVHHRSRKVDSHSYWPIFIVNNKGTKIVFKSTFGVGGPDLYLLDVNLTGE